MITRGGWGVGRCLGEKQFGEGEAEQGCEGEPGLCGGWAGLGEGKAGAELVPEEQTERGGEGAEEEQAPGRGAEAEEVARVAGAEDGAEADVDAIGNEAEAGEELEERMNTQLFGEEK